MTLLTIVQSAADVIGVPRPSTVVSSTDQQVRTLLALANREGEDLAARYSWQALIKEVTWSATAAEDQGLLSSLISDGDFDGWILHRTIWNRDEDEPIRALTATRWQSYKATTTPLIYEGWRIQNDRLYITPAPTAGHTHAFEYVSAHWCQSSGGAGQSAWAADTDTGVLSERLMRLGLIWRFKQAKGLDYAEDMATHERQVADAMGRDGAKPTLYAGQGDDTPRAIAVTEGNWNLS